MTVTPDDYRWRTIVPVRLRDLAGLGGRRRANARARGRVENIPGLTEAEYLRIEVISLAGEYAVWTEENPCHWNRYEDGDLRGLPDIEAPLKTREHKLDVKTNKCEYPINFLMIPLAVDIGVCKSWFYVACFIAWIDGKWPRVCMMGWCRGEEAMQRRFKKQQGEFPVPIGGRPAYCVPVTDPVIKPMCDLRVLIHGRARS